ncbi:protein of unknown function [Stenotrophomonas maltophilia]|nr:protein of unknown function [Stenotrophomonas maltophilia]
MTAWTAFALVDCAAAPEREGELRHYTQQDTLPHRSLFTGQPESDLAQASPWLIELPWGAIQRPVHHWLTYLGRQSSGITILASATAFDPLFQHLQTKLDISLPDGSLALMRYYDPRAFLRYCDVLTPRQQLDLLGPILEWQVTLNSQDWTLVRADLERPGACDADTQR